LNRNIKKNKKIIIDLNGWNNKIIGTKYDLMKKVIKNFDWNIKTENNN